MVLRFVSSYSAKETRASHFAKHEVSKRAGQKKNAEDTEKGKTLHTQSNTPEGCGSKRKRQVQQMLETPATLVAATVTAVTVTAVSLGRQRRLVLGLV